MYVTLALHHDRRYLAFLRENPESPKLIGRGKVLSKPNRRALWIIVTDVILLISSTFPYNEFQTAWAHELSIGLE